MNAGALVDILGAMRATCIVLVGLAAGCADDPAPGPSIELTTLEWRATGAPAAGIPAYLVRPDGTIGARGVTDAGGSLTLAAEPGSTLVVVHGRPPGEPEDRGYLVVYGGVQPGDHLVTGGVSAYPGVETAATMSFSFPSVEAVTVSTACGAVQAQGEPAGERLSSVALHLTAGCEVTTGGALYVGFEATGLRGYAWRPAVSLRDGASDAITAWTPPAQLALSASQLPAGVTSASWLIDPLIGGRHVIGSAANGPVSGGATSVTASWAAGGEAVRIGLRLRGGGHDQVTRTVVDGTPTAFAMDAPALLPTLGGGATDPTTLTTRWTISGAGAHDAALAAVTTRPVASPTRICSWQFVLPAGTTEAPLPPVPADLAAATCQDAPAERAELGWVRLLDLDGRTYDDVRALPLAALLAGDVGPGTSTDNFMVLEL